ncbi:hypothetical protein HanRHA438_Chr10g0463121 [Helianthus annuus]|nr:hypothetical protein HanRHA438_Chr10g0463121 [Helianthus annuus]
MVGVYVFFFFFSGFLRAFVFDSNPKHLFLTFYMFLFNISNRNNQTKHLYMHLDVNVRPSVVGFFLTFPHPTPPPPQKKKKKKLKHALQLPPMGIFLEKIGLGVPNKTSGQVLLGQSDGSKSNIISF